MKQLGIQANEYRFENGTLYINGSPFDFDAVVSAVVDGVSAQMAPRHLHVSEKNLIEKKACVGKLSEKDSRRIPEVLNVETLKASFVRLSEDLYLKAQVGVVALSFEEKLHLLAQHGYEMISVELTKDELTLGHSKMYAHKLSAAGVPVEKRIADALISIELPSMRTIREPVEKYLKSDADCAGSFFSEKGSGILKIEINATLGLARVSEKTYFPMQNDRQVIDRFCTLDYHALLCAMEPIHKATVERILSHREDGAPTAPKQRTPNKAFDM